MCNLKLRPLSASLKVPAKISSYAIFSRSRIGEVLKIETLKSNYLLFFKHSRLPPLLAKQRWARTGKIHGEQTNLIILFITLHLCYVNVIYGEGLRGAGKEPACTKIPCRSLIFWETAMTRKYTTRTFPGGCTIMRRYAFTTNHLCAPRIMHMQ